MTRAVLRTWFLCTLLVAGLLAPPVTAGAGDCCSSGASGASGGVAASCSPAPAAPGPAADHGCCPSETSTAAPAGTTDPADAASCDDCDDCQGCDAGCRCLRCGCGHAGHPPAVRPTPISLALIAPTVALAAPDRGWSARDDAGDLLRPPRS